VSCVLLLLSLSLVLHSHVVLAFNPSSYDIRPPLNEQLQGGFGDWVTGGATRIIRDGVQLTALPHEMGSIWNRQVHIVIRRLTARAGAHRFVVVLCFGCPLCVYVCVCV